MTIFFDGERLATDTINLKPLHEMAKRLQLGRDRYYYFSDVPYYNVEASVSFERIRSHGVVSISRKSLNALCYLLKRTKVIRSWDAEDGIIIGRGTKWGCPFIGPRNVILAKYEKYLLEHKLLLGSLHELQGKNLICSCAPKPCHGEILAYYADLEKFNEK